METQLSPPTARVSALAPAPLASDPAASTTGLQAFRCLEAWLCSAPSKRLGLPQIERESERRGRELLRLLLQAHLDGRGSGQLENLVRMGKLKREPPSVPEFEGLLRS
jgi:hypothetical protein